MAITEAQRRKISQNRKRNPPSYYSASAGESYQITADTEAVLILTGSSVKQQAAQYLDLLLNANPSKDDHDAITARAAEKQISNLTSKLSELEPIIDDFEDFRDDLVHSDQQDEVYARGMQPLVQSFLSGFGSIRNRIDALRFNKKVQSFAQEFYSPEVTDEQRKEWRSWKRVLLSYP
jgi:molecular chaperone GrpE (heat shock protein)